MKKKTVNVYTDGSYSDSDLLPCSGVGVWFGENHPWNVAQAGFAKSSNEAELSGVETGYKIIFTAPKKKKCKYVICTDSSSVVNAITNKKPFKPTAHRENKILNNIFSFQTKKGVDVDIKLVKGHSGLPGNDGAHKLANQGRKTALKVVRLLKRR